MQQKIATFKSITEDYDIEEDEVLKFIKWAKGNIQQALNYYYVHLERGKIKRRSTANQNLGQSKTQSQPSPNNLKSSTQMIEEKQRYSEMERSSDEQFSGKDAFSVLKEGSIQHKKTHDFIKKVRQTYRLPIKGRPQKELLDSSKSCLPEHQNKIPPQFKMSDCLGEAFNQKTLDLMISQKQQQMKKQSKQAVINERFPRQKVSEIQREQYVELQLSSSHQMEDEQSFKDIECYTYKHVYTNPDSIKKEKKKEQEARMGRKTRQSSRIHQGRRSEEAISEEIQQPEQSLFEDKGRRKKIPKKNSKIGKGRSKSQKIGKEVTLEQKQTVVKKKQKAGKEEKDTIIQDQIYVGQYFVKGVFTEKFRLDQKYIGSRVEVSTYIEEIKTKKSKFGKNSERNMNIRISFGGREVARLNIDQVRIIMPLIGDKLIRVEFFLHEAPSIADIFTKMTLAAKVYFLKNLITQPIIQNFQAFEFDIKDKDRVHQLSGLLQKLGLPILAEPLIKSRSKYIKVQKPKKKYESIDLVPQPIKKMRDEEKIRQEMEEKYNTQLNRMKTDPNYKQVQTSIRQLIARNQDNLKLKQVQTTKQIDYLSSQVKKKVIEIDTKEEKNKLAELIQLHQQNCIPYEPQKDFRSKLYPYQALALGWMLGRQGFLQNKQEKEELHPLWTQYEIITTENPQSLYFNQLTGQLCLKRPISKLKCKGGILADEMGLGKTVMMTALIASNPLILKKSPENAGTLVIVPLTLLSQWESQIQRHSLNQKVIIYYSHQRKKIMNTLNKYDVVLSTYGTISHQFASSFHTKKQGIYKYKWHRIILDEAHYIKGRVIQTSKAVYEIDGEYRWCLTGTPIQNNVTDIFSLLHFIKYTPWSQFACWNRFIAKPLEEGDESIYNILKTILKQVFLRRTKCSQDSEGKSIIQLPTRVSKVQLLTMSEKEKQFYNSIYEASRSSFDELINKGILQARYMQVFQMLMRLRQICCHPILFKSITKFSKNTEQFEKQLKKLMEKSLRKAPEGQQSEQYYEPIIGADNEQIQIKTNSSTINQQYYKQVIQKIGNESLDNCMICLQQPQSPVINYCLHIFCKACNIRQIQQKGSCSFCRRTLTKEDFINLPREDRLNLNKQKLKEQMFLSTKMIALNQHLSQLQPEDKVVIFSQFLGMLDLLEMELKNQKLKYVRMEGSNSHKERTRIVKTFQQDPSVQIFLVSLKTAGVGLNLVAANKVFLMDPWWNPAVQQQAIERVHRIGQKREVEIVRFILDKTIETRMLELNTEKKALSQSVLNQEKDIGSTRQKIERLKYLMQTY